MTPPKEKKEKQATWLVNEQTISLFAWTNAGGNNVID